MPDYAQDAIDARNTLKEDGQLVRVRVYTDVGYDDNNSEVTRTWVDSYVYGAVFDFNYVLNTRSMSGEEIEAGDKRLYLASDVVITPGNVNILIGNIEYKVIGVGEVNPAGIVILYDLHLRK
jgi:hypothetical protein